MKTCIVIPLYNESSRFDTKAFKLFVLNNDIQFCLVNDGSNDETKQIIEDLSNSINGVYALNIEKNKGKAEAVRLGVNYVIEHLNCNAVGYYDADFATPLIELRKLNTFYSENNFTFIMGSRIKRLGATINRYKSRHFSGRFIATFISEYILNLPVYDTQCGVKIINIEVAKVVFNDNFKSKWLFDVELIARMKKHYGRDYCLKNVYEYPLSYWEDKGNSKITFKDALFIPHHLLKLYFHYR
ncbi:MAG: glycosyl transferase family 2 [Bacteroidetes bacterium]|nr:MAG: glycosyl transferase family 2 [Bacteroidota bacterium]